MTNGDRLHILDIMSKPTKPPRQIRFILRQESREEMALWDYLQDLTVLGQASGWIRRTLIAEHRRVQKRTRHAG